MHRNNVHKIENILSPGERAKIDKIVVGSRKYYIDWVGVPGKKLTRKEARNKSEQRKRMAVRLRKAQRDIKSLHSAYEYFHGASPVPNLIPYIELIEQTFKRGQPRDWHLMVALSMGIATIGVVYELAGKRPDWKHIGEIMRDAFSDVLAGDDSDPAEWARRTFNTYKVLIHRPGIHKEHDVNLARKFLDKRQDRNIIKPIGYYKNDVEKSTQSTNRRNFGPQQKDALRQSSFRMALCSFDEPADRPLKPLKKFKFSVDLKAAKQAGVTIPPDLIALAPDLIALADEVTLTIQPPSREVESLIESLGVKKVNSDR